MTDLRIQHDAPVEQALDLVGEIRPLLRQRYTGLRKRPVEPTQEGLHHMERILSLLGEAIADLGVAVRGDAATRRRGRSPPRRGAWMPSRCPSRSLA